MDRFFQMSDLVASRAASGKRYLKFLRVPALSTGVYVLPVGEKDGQSPHREDEVYYVVSGRARMKIVDASGNIDDRAVTAGTVIFVEAHAEHRFHSIEEELVLLVFFAPAETM